MNAQIDLQADIDRLSAERAANVDAPLQDRAPLFQTERGDEVRTEFSEAIADATTRALTSGQRQVVRQTFPDDAVLARIYTLQSWR